MSRGATRERPVREDRKPYSVLTPAVSEKKYHDRRQRADHHRIRKHFEYSENSLIVRGICICGGMCGRRGATSRFVRQYAAGDSEAHGAAQRKASRTARRGFKRERGAEDIGEYPRSLSVFANII